MRLPLELHFRTSARFACRSLIPGSFEHEVATRGRLIHGAHPAELNANEGQRAAAKAEIVREWLVRAHGGLRTALLALNAEHSLPDIACFHSHQAAERSLRALLQWHEVATANVRDLDALADLCDLHEPRIAELRPELQPLSVYDETILYPPAREKTPSEARAAVAAAERLCAAVLEYLPTETHP
jgi:HEPN domain-containing protein